MLQFVAVWVLAVTQTANNLDGVQQAYLPVPIVRVSNTIRIQETPSA
jgi:hypothetical protein